MSQRRTLLATLVVSILSAPTLAVDLKTIDRSIKKEPRYLHRPAYGLLVFGKKAGKRVWLVVDGRRLYIDLNGNGDLTEPSEWLRGSGGSSFEVDKLTEADGTTVHRYLRCSVDEERDLRLSIVLASGRRQFVGYYDVAQPRPRLAARPQDAPVIHLNGPTTLARHGLIAFLPRTGSSYKRSLRLMIGTRGLGAGTFAAYDSKTLLDGQEVTVDLEYPNSISTAKPITRRHHFTPHDRKRNFLCGAIDVPGNVGTGSVKITLSMPDWKEEDVKPATYRAWIIGASKDLPTVVAALATDDAALRHVIMHSFGRYRLNRDEILKALVTQAGHADAKMRRRAVFGLTGFKTPQVFALLVQALDDRDDEVRASAIGALRGHQDQAASIVPRLVAATSNEALIVRRAAASELRAFAPHGPAAFQTLLRLLDDPDRDLRVNALGSLEIDGRNSLKALPKILPLLRSREPEVRNAAIRAVAAIDRSAAGPIIEDLKAAEEHAETVQQLAAAALRAMGPRLRHNKSGTIKSIYFYESQKVSNDDLRLLRHMPDIELLSNVCTLSLWGTKVTDEGLGFVAGRLTQLNILSLSGRPVTDDGLKHLREMKALHSLDLSGTRISAAGLRHLDGLTRLDSLYLADTGLTDDALQHIEPLSALEYLGLSGTRITDEGMKRLGKLTRLRSLSLSGRQITNESVKHIADLPQLWNLSLSGTRITDEGLMHLPKLKRLSRLFLRGAQVTSSGLSHLTPIQRLGTLDLRDSLVDDKGIVHLAKLKNLTSLRLDGTRITKEGIQQLKAQLPKIRLLTP